MTQQFGWSPPDHVLVAGLRDGDSTAGDLLVARYYGHIFAQMLNETRDAELARDLTQDTFEVAVRRLYQLRDDRLFASWLHGIARNRARSEWRLRPAWRLLPLEAASQATSPADTEQVGLVQEALTTLDPNDRQLLIQHVLWGMAPAEIAANLGATRGAVYQRLARAKERLRGRIEQLRAAEEETT